MSDSVDIVRAFENVNPEFLGIENEQTTKIIAEDPPTVSKIREIVLQYVSKERGRTVDDNASISTWRTLRHPDDAGDIQLRLPYEAHREGHFKIREWHSIRVDGSYVDGNIRFEVVLRYQFDIFLGQENIRQWDRYVPKLVGNHHVDLLTRPLDVPLELTWYWMNKKNGEPEFYVLSTDKDYLTYDTGVYPISLYRFFALAGSQVYEMLFRQGVLNEETYVMIKSRLSWHQQSGSEQQAQSKPAGPTSTTQAEIPNYAEQLVEIRMEDRKRLRVIGTTSIPHSIRSWSELLGFKGNSPGAAEAFIERMSGGSLITIEKTANGRYLRLTDRARRILRAA